MTLYRFKYKKENQEIEETKEYTDKSSLYSDLHSQGAELISCQEISQKNIKFSFSIKKVKPQEKISFAKNLAVMIDAGLSVNRAISIIGKQSRNKKFNQILSQISEDISRGESFSDALKKHSDIFSDLFCAMVKAGEESGTLSNSLKSVANQLEKSHKLNKKIIGAMIYPTIIIVLMIVVGFLMMVFMVPMITETFKGLNVPLPLATRVLIAISDFLKSNILIVLGFAVVIFVSLFYFAKSKKGKKIIDFSLLKIPVISTMVKEVNSARTARTLGSLVSSGVDIVSAIKVTENVVQNVFYKQILTQSAVDVEKGETMSSIFSKYENLYPIFMSEMISVGEETGKISKMFENVADYYENEVEEKTKNLSTIIEPFLMILIGITVGIFAVAMLAPTYSLVDVIGA